MQDKTVPLKFDNKSNNTQFAVNLVSAHAVSMILSWITFASMGIFFSRYGCPLRLGTRQQLLGKVVWFQIHRFLLSLSPLLTPLGFLFILIYAGGRWVNSDQYDLRLFIHSIFGAIILLCSIMQMWFSLYRCHPQSRFRFIFDWFHRIVGFLSFGLSIPKIFLISTLLPKFCTIIITCISIWTLWVVTVL